MKSLLPSAAHELSRLAEEASALLAATTEVAGEKVGTARQRVEAALERSRAALDQARHQATLGVRAVDEVVHEHPYPVIALGVGIGALMGFCIARLSTRHR